MSRIVLAVCLGVLGVAYGASAPSGMSERLDPAVGTSVEAAGRSGALEGGELQANRRICPSNPTRRVDIRRNDEHDLLHKALREPNAMVVLGPNVELDFSHRSDLLPLEIGVCVTLTSTALVDSVVARRGTAAPNTRAGRHGVDPSSIDSAATDRTPLRVPDHSIGGNVSARTPHSLGPLLRFGKHPPRTEAAFLVVWCDANRQPSDHVRISGFRLEGPSLDQQTEDVFGILIYRCLDIEVSNMEIFGWGGAGVRVLDDKGEGPGQVAPANRPGERIGRPDQVRIFNNYFHHNQHASEDESVPCDASWDSLGANWVWCKAFRGHAAGYGVDVHHGAWAQIYFNLFDVNRHAIAASGFMGGYDARWNLTLKGGGYHGRTFNKYTHQFDVHGTKDNGLGGDAGVQAWFVENSFQYRNGPAIKIRGRPRLEMNIGGNVFPHRGLEGDRGDDAIHLDSRSDLDVIKLRPGNAIDVDTYGRYGVCDFDGDGVDDLFLPTGRTWWFSSFGQFPWTYLTARSERIEQVRLGYFDDDRKCDVLTQSGRDWVISSGGTGPWTSIGRHALSLDDVVFGQFDPNVRDSRAGATRRTTHAFRRVSSGQWQVAPLTDRRGWVDVQRSELPMSSLRFGDFTGDGVTDVLGVTSGRWHVSESARGAWRLLNPSLGDDVGGFYIADLNHNNIDDVIRLERQAGGGLGQSGRITFIWYVSDDGRSRWRELRRYTWDHKPADVSLSGHAFAGRFGAAPGGGVLLTGPDRIGHFFSPAEAKMGKSPDWRSLFGY